MGAFLSYDLRKPIWAGYGIVITYLQYEFPYENLPLTYNIVKDSQPESVLDYHMILSVFFLRYMPT